MSETTLTETIKDQADRALWEVENILHCIPDEMWNAPYCDMPTWKHIYHMLHSLDQWYINPQVYTQPPFHTADLNNLDVQSDTVLSRQQMYDYFAQVKGKITAYNDTLTDALLLQKPENCEWNRFTLILAQHRHLHSHMGMLMGFIIAGSGLWPKVLGLTGAIPQGELGSFC